MSFGDAALAPETPRAEVGTDPRGITAEIAVGFAPGAGLADATGKFPAFSDKEQEFYDGLLTNVQNKKYGMAAMQGLAMLGDAMWAGGPIAGAVGTAGKMPLALSRALAKRSSSFQKLFRGSRVVDTADGGPSLVFHGTLRDFKHFDPEMGELGTHFGTLTQAEMFVRPGAEWRNLTGQNLRAGYLKIKNPLRLEDRMTFDVTSSSTRAQLRQVLGESLPERGLTKDTRDISNLPIQRAIKAKGYDGIVYLNRNEGIDREFKRPADMVYDAWERHLNSISDAEFRKIFPEAQDSYIIFDSDQFINALGIAAE